MTLVYNSELPILQVILRIRFHTHTKTLQYLTLFVMFLIIVSKLFLRDTSDDMATDLVRFTLKE